jgi:ribonuclease III
MKDKLDLETIERIIGYHFNQKRHIVCALTRRSYWHENRATCTENNERMEFLGDAVLGLIIGHILYRRFPDDDEGELQKKRAGLVNRAALARLMRRLELAPFIRMGRGDEMSGCRDLDSILADTLEAVIAAVYLDGGFHAAEKMIEKHFYPMIESCGTREGTEDYRSLLQERVQAERGLTPRYQVIDEWGEDHRKTFKVAVYFGDQEAGTGVGSNKREAAQRAARQALESM